METRKKALADIKAALKSKPEKTDTGSAGVQELIAALLAEPDPKKRKRMTEDYKSRHADVAAFIAENEELINAEAEAALICAAVGGTSTEKEISYKGGRRTEIIKKKSVMPNVAALNIFLKNRMPEKYSDKPQTEIEIEDVTEINEVIDNETESQS